MKAINFRGEPVYKARSQPDIIDVPKMLFATVDGEGPPEGNSRFQEAMQVLFGIFYSIKFWDKKHKKPAGFAQFSTPPVEGLWWTKSGREFNLNDLNDWQWKVMIRLPDFVTPKLFKEVVNELCEKKQSDIYRKARLEPFTEGRSVQIMHIGPYDQETADINKMHAYAHDQGYQITGKHHELYFSDPRRTKPEKLRTIIRHAVLKGGLP